MSKSDNKLSTKLIEEIIKQRRREGIDQKRMAEIVGINLRSYTMIETGKTQKIPAEVILKACQYLHIPIEEFINPELKQEKEDIKSIAGMAKLAPDILKELIASKEQREVLNKMIGFFTENIKSNKQLSQDNDPQEPEE